MHVDAVRSSWAPKPDGGRRRMARLSELDDARWHRVAGAVAEVVEPKLSPSVLANRASGPAPRWRLRPLEGSLPAARRLARRLPGPVILRTDVREFYPSVHPGALFDALRGLLVPAEVARTAAGLLEGWGSDGYAGLPIGPPASAIMANAILASVDEALAPRPFLRWVDDYLVSAPSVTGAHHVLERLEESLGLVGLRRSSSKTALLEPGPALRWLGPSGG